MLELKSISEVQSIVIIISMEAKQVLPYITE
jgi:hypothetical protein